MKPVLTARQMLAADSAAIAAGTPSPVLMERAARGVMKVLQAEFDTGGTVAVFCGPATTEGTDFCLPACSSARACGWRSAIPEKHRGAMRARWLTLAR